MTDDLPTFKKGDPVSAAALNKLSDAMRGTVLGPGMFQSDDEQLQRRLGGGGDSTTNVTKFATVTVDTSNENGALECILLDEDHEPVHDLSPESDGYADHRIEYKNADVRDHEVGMKIMLHSNRLIEEGSEYDDNKAWGTMVEPAKLTLTCSDISFVIDVTCNEETDELETTMGGATVVIGPCGGGSE